MADCPHCSKDLGSDFMASDEHVRRLNAKKAENDQLKAKVAELTPKASAHAALEAERDEWKGKYEAHITKEKRTDLLTGKGISADLLSGFETMFNSAQVDAEGEGKDFAAWFAEDAASHPLLAPHFAAGSNEQTGEQSGEDGGVGPEAQGGGLSKVAAKTKTPPPPQGKMSTEQQRAYFRSPTYRNLTPAEQRKKFNEMQAAAHAQKATG